MKPTALLALMVVMGGCVTAPATDPKPEARSLGRDLTVFQTSAEDRPTKVEPTGSLSLQQGLALALLHNPQLEAYAWHLRAREAAILQSHLRPNPVLGLKVENFGGRDALRDFDGAVSTLRISQAIELGDKRIKRTRLAQREHALSAWDYEAQRLQVIAQTGQRYIAVLAAQRNVELAEQSLQLTEGLYTIIEDRTNQGVTPTAERDKARVQVTARQIDLEERRRQLATLRQELAAMWDANDTGFQAIDTDFIAVAEPPAYASLLDKIYQNPDLARWSMEIAARQAAVALADSRAVPNVTIGAGVRRFNTTDNNALVFELGLPLPLINRNQGARQQARYDLQRSEALHRHAEATARTTLHRLFQELKAQAFAATRLRDQSLPAARAAYSAAKKGFTEGMTDYLHVLDAERTLIDTQYDHVAALAGYHQTHIDLESFLGTSL